MIFGYPRMNSVVDDKLPHMLNFANAYVKGCELEEENRVLKHQLRLQMDANRRKNNTLRGLRAGRKLLRAEVQNLRLTNGYRRVIQGDKP